MPIASLSFKSCNTNAEEDRARLPPTVIAAAVGRPQTTEIAEPAAAVTRNCALPSPKTSFFMAFRRATESSRPISKRKKTIPSSPAKKEKGYRRIIIFKDKEEKGTGKRGKQEELMKGMKRERKPPTRDISLV